MPSRPVRNTAPLAAVGRAGALAVALAALTAASSAAAAAAEEGSAVNVDAVAIGDVLRTTRPSQTSALGHLDVRIDGDAARLFGWSGTTLHLEAIADEGGKPNARLQTLQGISNIEVKTNAVRLYAAWLQHTLGDAASVLVGLYDLNSEFYATDASSLLIHPAFGIGAELGQTGRNGPSIFPDLAFGVRVAGHAGNGAYAQMALLDATAGDPAHPGRLSVRIGAPDGVLAVGEAGWRGAAETRRGGDQWGVGVWSYSEPLPRVEGSGRARSAGAYALAQATLPTRVDAPRVAVFARAGFATPGANAIGRAFDAGVVVHRTGDDDGPRAWTVGIAQARLGAPARAAAASATARAETAVEVGARWRFGRHVAVQPLAQQIVHPGGRAGAHATVVGVRALWFASGSDD